MDKKDLIRTYTNSTIFIQRTIVESTLKTTKTITKKGEQL